MKQKTVLILLLTVIIILATLTIIIRHQQNDETMIKEIIVHPPYASSEAKGKQYVEVLQEYQNAEFNDISFEKIDDLIFGWLTKDGEVEKVEINGSTDYTAETAYKQNEAKVMIYYHTFPEKTEATDNSTSNDEIIKNSTNGDVENTETTLDNMINEINTTEQTETEVNEENMESTILEVTATEILKLAENQNFEGLPFNASTKEIYNVYDNKRVAISGTIEDIQYDSIYLNCNDKGYNSVGADTTLVVYCKVKDLSKYNIGQEVSITGTANCYRYSVIINEE